MTNIASDAPTSLLEGGADALQAAATVAGRQLPSAGTLVADAPHALTDAGAALAGPGAQAVAVQVTGAATGTVTLVVTAAVAEALQEGPLGAADLASALITPVTDAIAELEAVVGGALTIGLADAVEAGAIDFGSAAVAVPLVDAGTPVAVLVVELAAGGEVPSLSTATDDVAAFTPFVDDGSPEQAQRSMELLHDVEMAVTVELGRTRMAVSDLLSLAPGAVVELDRAAGSPVDVLVNGKLIARGEVVVIDEDFGIRISEIVGLQPNRS